MTTLFAPAAEQALHANLTFDFYRMIAATRKRELTLRRVNALSNLRDYYKCKGRGQNVPLPCVRSPKFPEGF